MHIRPTLYSFVITLCLILPSHAQELAQKPGQAAIASAHPMATAAGFEVLQAGGNAFDAAIAVSATLSVVEPSGSGLGGGGFWLLHRAADGFETMLDAREKAPRAASRNMFLDEKGDVIANASSNGALAAAIPGQPAALAYLAERYGKLPLAQSLAPAIRAARDGFMVTEHYRNLAKNRLEAMRADDETANIFLRNNQVPALNTLITQPDLANTLNALAQQGRAGFYQGKVAQQLLDAVLNAGGIWSQQDLDSYKVVEREPLHGNYGDIRITSAAPPSSGGVALLTMLNILACYDLAKLDEAGRVHLLVEAMRRAYRDRAEYLGDPDFVRIPEQLSQAEYGKTLAATIQIDKATSSLSLNGKVSEQKGTDTSHFSIIDADGNRVAATQSLNSAFGSAFTATGTGILLNNEMDDFSAKPGVPNNFGLVGAEANAIAAEKRPLSSMTPTFLASPDRVAILGTPGGSRIITMVLLATLEFAAGKTPQQWVSLPRFHHQYLPDEIQFESNAFSSELQQKLGTLGHSLKVMPESYGNMQAVLWNRSSNELSAASDPRGGGEAVVKAIQNTSEPPSIR